MDNLLKSCASSFKKHDMFGHSIQLNFDRKGDTHKTCIGGFVTSFVHIIVFIYIFLNMKKMLLLEDNKNFTEIGVTNLEEKGIIDYGETNILVYMAIRDQINGQVFINSDEF